jgi:hypothetical protein
MSHMERKFIKVINVVLFMHAYHELVTCFLSKSPDPLCKGEQFDNDNEKLEATKNFLFSGQTQSSLTQDMNE